MEQWLAALVGSPDSGITQHSGYSTGRTEGVMIRIRRTLGGVSVLALVLAITALASPAHATHVGCGDLITEDITLDGDIGPCPGDGLIVVADNVTVDLNGFRIFAANGPGDNAGITFGRLAAPPATPGGTPIEPVVVNGGTVMNGTVEGFDAGVVLAGGSGHTVQNMTIQNNVNDYLGPPCNLGDGVAIFNSSDNQILDNTLIANGPYGGISVIEDSDRNLISGNTVLGHNLRSRGGSGCGNNNQDEGIRIEGPGAEDNIVENNRVEGSGLAGIGLHGYVCTTAGGDELDDPNTGTIVRRNTVVNNEQDGIALLQQGPATIVCPSFGNTIERNVSSDNGGDGIFVAANSYDNVISHNVVSNNEGAGIRLNDPRFNNQGVLTAPAPYNNTLIGNRGSGNGEVDGYDGNLEPPCDNNKWRASRFVTVNQPCVVGPGGSGKAKGRTGERPGNADRGPEIGDARGRSAGSRV
jgi:parallel beta-helix repeat protein